MKRLIIIFEAFGTMKRQKGSGRLRRAATIENEEAVEEMICSQADHPRTHEPSEILLRG